MCIQLLALDRALGDFFAKLDATGIDYVVVLTADHGGNDVPERAGAACRAGRGADRRRARAGGDGQGDCRQARAARAGAAGLGRLRRLLHRPQPGRARPGQGADPAIAAYRAHPQVAAVFTHDELAAAPAPSGPPETYADEGARHAGLLRRLRRHPLLRRGAPGAGAPAPPVRQLAAGGHCVGRRVLRRGMELADDLGHLRARIMGRRRLGPRAGAPQPGRPASVDAPPRHARVAPRREPARRGAGAPRRGRAHQPRDARPAPRDARVPGHRRQPPGGPGRRPSPAPPWPRSR